MVGEDDSGGKTERKSLSDVSKHSPQPSDVLRRSENGLTLVGDNRQKHRPSWDVGAAVIGHGTSLNILA